MGKDFRKDLVACLNCMREDKVFLYPTDTVWGIGCDATNEAAVQRIIQIKQRPDHKSFVILVHSWEQLKKYVPDANETLKKYLDTVQRPTTVIYPGARGLARSVVAGDGSVAVRICRESFCLSLLEQAGKPLVSTSANLSGQSTPALFCEIPAAIKASVDYVVAYRQQETQRHAPSSIIKFHPEKDGRDPIEYLRL